MNQQKPEKIDVFELIHVLIHHAKIILLIAILFGVGGAVYGKFFIRPMYRASAMMIVNSDDRTHDYVSGEQINTSTKLVDTCAVIINSNVVMDQIKENLGMKQTYNRDVNNVSVASVNKTQIMRISVTASTADTALKVCEEITKVAPDVIVKTVKAGSVEIVATATTDYRNVSETWKRTAAKAFLFGLAFMICLVLIVDRMDNKVKGENDVLHADLPLLGVIPCYDLEEK